MTPPLPKFAYNELFITIHTFSITRDTAVSRDIADRRRSENLKLPDRSYTNPGGKENKEGLVDK